MRSEEKRGRGRRGESKPKEVVNAENSLGIGIFVKKRKKGD